MKLNILKWLFNMVIGQFMFYEGDKGGGGGIGDPPSFKESLGEFADNPALANIEDVGQLAKSLVDLKAYQGNSIRIPGEDAGEDAMKEFNEKLLSKIPSLMVKPNFENEEQSTEFYRQMGMPENSDSYELPEIEGIDPKEIDTETTAFMKGLFHSVGLNKVQFKKVSEAMIKEQHGVKIVAAEKIAEGMKFLRREWGNAFDINMKASKQAAIDTGAPESLIKAIETNLIGADTLKWLHNIGTQLGGEGTQMGNQGDGGSNIPMTPSEAQIKIDEIMDNKEHPYWVAAHPSHDNALKNMVELQRHAMA